MPAIINIAANLILGASLAIAVRHSPAVRRDPVSWPLLLLLAFEAAVFTPTATYLFRFHTQWSMLYWFDPQIHPEFESWTGLLSALAVVLNFMAAIVGYFAARSGFMSGRLWPAIAPIAAGLATAAAVGLLYGERIIFVGDYDEFWQGQADLLLERAPGWVGATLYAAAILFVVGVRTRLKDGNATAIETQ